MVAIGIRTNAGQALARLEPSILLDNDGYYWFLHPLFEQLRDKTGQYIDLYDDAVFEGEALIELERTLTLAKDEVGALPPTWDVSCGWQILPVRREVFKPVVRAEFLRLLDTWELIVARAKATGRRVVCFGD